MSENIAWKYLNFKGGILNSSNTELGFSENDLKVKKSLLHTPFPYVPKNIITFFNLAHTYNPSSCQTEKFGSGKEENKDILQYAKQFA